MIYEFKDEYDWLSNFSDVDVILDGITFKSVEHAYQSAKSEDKNWKNFCSDYSNSAGKIKKESHSIIIKENWEDIRVSIMFSLLVQKFNTEPYKTKLIETGEVYIQEGNNWNDKFWGFCFKTNYGKNNLGKLIMVVRNDLTTNKLF